MTLSAKAQTIERDFLVARSKGNYAAFSELARRYRKHNKDGEVFIQTALLEKAVAEAEAAAIAKERWSSSVSLNDTPESIASFPLFHKSTIDEAIKALEDSLSKGSDEDQENAAIVLARASMATNVSDRIQRTRHYLRNIELPPARIPTGHYFALVICGLFTKGLMLEEEGAIPEAIVCYDNISLMTQAHPNERSEELQNWTEHAFYRGSMLKWRQGDQLAAIRSFRTYHANALLWPNTFRLARRATVYRYFTIALTASYRTLSEASSSVNGANGNTDDPSQFYPPSMRQEIAQIHAYWEDALYAVLAFPKATEKNWHVLLMIEKIVSDRKLIGEGNDPDKRAHVETIYRASQKTFQSHRIMRFLFFALVELGQYDEAVLALKAYLEQVVINMELSGSGPKAALTTEECIRLDVESDQDIVQVMIAGSRLYSKELNDAVEALKCANLALQHIATCFPSTDVQDLRAKAYLQQGIAFGMQATGAYEPEHRPLFYTKAIEALEESVKFAPENFVGHYHLALQLAEMRNVSRAVLVVKQSLSLNAAHLPSWHLLSLLLSCQKEHEKALGICAIGLRESEWEQAETDLYSANQQEGEDYLALKITQAVLQEKVHGPESALELQENMFGLYARIFAPDPSLVGDFQYDVQSIRRRDPTEQEVPTLAANGNGTLLAAPAGRPRAGSILSTRSRNGPTGSDIGPANSTGQNTLDIPKRNYASSITSSIGSSGSKTRRLTPAIYTSSSAPVGRSHLSLPGTVVRPTGKSTLWKARSSQVLVTLWLLSAATFRRLGRLDDAQRSIEEAERTDASNPQVWHQLGLLFESRADSETAAIAYQKALALSPYHASTMIKVGQSYLVKGCIELAESSLETTTKSFGWDSAEAWFYLGKVFEASDRLGRAKECYWYALDLESTRPIRDFKDALPRFV